tara:strand:- start:875 stop:1330 length:456 start_codon:yes stop_codon:yes gene_type:complete
MAGKLRWDSVNRRKRMLDHGVEHKRAQPTCGTAKDAIRDEVYLLAIYEAAQKDEQPPPIPVGLNPYAKSAIEQHLRGVAGWAWSHPRMPEIVKAALNATAAPPAKSQKPSVRTGESTRLTCCVYDPDGRRCSGRATRLSRYCFKHRPVGSD